MARSARQSRIAAVNSPCCICTLPILSYNTNRSRWNEELPDSDRARRSLAWQSYGAAAPVGVCSVSANAPEVAFLTSHHYLNERLLWRHHLTLLRCNAPDLGRVALVVTRRR